MAFETSEAKKKNGRLLKVSDCPKVPALVKGRAHGIKGLHGGIAVVEEFKIARNAFLKEKLAEGYGFDEIARVFRLAGYTVKPSGVAHLASELGIRNNRRAKPATAKRNAMARQVAALIEDIVQERITPLEKEIARLKQIERKHNAFAKIFTERK